MHTDQRLRSKILVVMSLACVKDLSFPLSSMTQVVYEKQNAQGRLHE